MAGKPLAVAIDVDGSLSHSSKETELQDVKAVQRDEHIRIDTGEQPNVFTASGAGLQIVFQVRQFSRWVSACLSWFRLGFDSVSTRFDFGMHVMPENVHITSLENVF
eukprot:375486-Pelagomonas_calceolata.AAC.1